MGLVRHWRAMHARFDTGLLRPPAAAPDEAARLQRHADCAQALQAWCLPGGPPLAVGVLLAGDEHSPLDLVAWADAWARHLDGGTRLDALPRRAGLAWRLRIKFNEALPWRAHQPDDPWDAGWALAGSSTMPLWQAAWLPRRPTLVLANVADAALLAPALAALSQRPGPLGRPVRWLWVGGDGPTLPSLTGQRFSLGQASTASAGPR